jgi:hypothetical protein
MEDNLITVEFDAWELPLPDDAEETHDNVSHALSKEIMLTVQDYRREGWHLLNLQFFGGRVVITFKR